MFTSHIIPFLNLVLCKVKPTRVVLLWSDSVCSIENEDTVFVVKQKKTAKRNMSEKHSARKATSGKYQNED